MDPAPAVTVVDTKPAPELEPMTGYFSAMSFVVLFLVAAGLLLLVRLRKRGRHGVD